jgi:hypothetical protein
MTDPYIEPRAMALSAENGRLKDEIERLKADMDARMVAGCEYQEKDEAEIERLKALVKELANALGSALLFGDSLLYELAHLCESDDRQLPINLIMTKRTLDAAMHKLLTKVFSDLDPNAPLKDVTPEEPKPEGPT